MVKFIMVMKKIFVAKNDGDRREKQKRRRDDDGRHSQAPRTQLENADAASAASSRAIDSTPFSGGRCQDQAGGLPDVGGSLMDQGRG